MSRLPTDPDALLQRARADDRVALARLLSYVERGGATATAVAHLAYRSDVPIPSASRVRPAPGSPP